MLIYSISTGDFKPISFGANYLYNQYDKIHSFLIKNYNEKYKDILAKPILSGNEVNWYGNFNAPLSRLSDLSQETQTIIKTEYWEAKNSLSDEIKNLGLSREKEKQNWANLLTGVFNDENNIVLSDGEKWCLLWGWEFNNKQENYLVPSFPKQTPKVSQEDPSPLQPAHIVQNEITSDENSNINLDKNIHIAGRSESTSVNSLRNSPSFWDKIKRFLRRLVYRIWGLLFLIMLVLFIMCLCKKCCNRNCNEMDDINNKLIQIEKKLDDKCTNNK